MCGWPTPEGQYTLYWDNSRTFLSKEGGFLKTPLYVHSASSGGPCVDDTGGVLGILSWDNDMHGTNRYESRFRDVNFLLHHDYDLPAEVRPKRLAPRSRSSRHAIHRTSSPSPACYADGPILTQARCAHSGD